MTWDAHIQFDRDIYALDIIELMSLLRYACHCNMPILSLFYENNLRQESYFNSYIILPQTLEDIIQNTIHF